MKNLKLVSNIIEKLKVKSLRGIVLSLGIIFGVFVILGQVQASTADQLQPASTITYNEELVINATGRFNSVYIGKQGTGGVTFFNGTIINTTTNNGADNPVTFGDNVRIDGILLRSEEGGDKPLKIGDTLRPETTASYDLGTTGNQFRNAYFSGTVTVAALSGTGIVNSANILDGTIATADLADSAVTTAKIADGTITGNDILSTTDISVDAITATGEIRQSISVSGAMKAMIYVPYNGDCTSANSRQWTSDGSTVTCSYTSSPGIYTLTFGSDVSARYWQVTPSILSGDPGAGTQYFTAPSSDPNHKDQIIVALFDTTGNVLQSGFMITLY